MKEIKVKYTDWWAGFNPEEYRIHKILSKHFQVVLSEEPDYVISSVYSQNFIKYDCIRILYTGENVCPDFNLFDYGIGFEYIDFGDRYIRFPNWMMNPVYEIDIERMRNKHIFSQQDIEKKVDFCDFIYSNGRADTIRQEIFYKLNNYKKVDSGGKFLNNIGLPSGITDKYEFQKRHKFSIAFENSAQPGYTTEKLIHSFAAQTIPIYWGDPLVTNIFNKKAMINVYDYSNLDEVVQKVMEVDQNRDLYCEMLAQPALLQEKNILSAEYQKLEDFLVNIFSQPKEVARRRNHDINNYCQRNFLGVDLKKNNVQRNILTRFLHAK